ncbi:hypothetical protein RvY_16333 [Ramazzottius varieornatus]|uniref:Uncharacterized protein n=1 Tax=Ramazzottius varieornatus TaxID=947166 RepID=A0A1D1VZ02_RAMVA|nr:hypothetical protein RvY_16333 [Ramazzottius varieornatus]
MNRIDGSTVFVSSWSGGGSYETIFLTKRYLDMGVGQRAVIFIFGINDIIEHYNHPSHFHLTNQEWERHLTFMMRPLRDFLVEYRHKFNSLFATDIFPVTAAYGPVGSSYKADRINHIVARYNVHLRDLIESFGGEFILTGLQPGMDGVHLQQVRNGPLEQKPKILFAHMVRDVVYASFKRNHN